MISAALFVVCFLPFIYQVSASTGNSYFTTVISIVPQAEREYLRYFKHSLDNSPVKKYSKFPEKLYIICKAAEFAASRYSKEENRFHLRNILSVKSKEEPRYQVLSYRLLLRDSKTGQLQNQVFDVRIVKRKDAKYTVQVESQKQKRSELVSADSCDELSLSANCSSCGYKGICHKGTARISPWLAFALKTQRQLQVNMSFDRVQMLAAHNAFNDRADGYGQLDDCRWPPPYKHECIDLANQEFSFTDLLNMGIRALEIDPWWCFGKIRMSHAHKHAYLGCGPWDREFQDGIREIAEWTKQSGNKNEIVRLYLEDGPQHTVGHDDYLNGPISAHFTDKVLTPNDIKTLFNGKWPTPYEMQQRGKTVIISSGNSYNHQGKYIHKGYWRELTTNEFFSYSGCAAVNESLKPLRVYSDSTEYGPFWDGPKKTGSILDYMNFLKCGVIYPAADQVNPHLLGTAVFTWAKNEPSSRLKPDTCVAMHGDNKRWYVENCRTKNSFACAHTGNREENKWLISTDKGPYTRPQCPKEFEFSIPRNAFEHHQLLKQLIDSQNVWLNFSKFIPLVID